MDLLRDLHSVIEWAEDTDKHVGSLTLCIRHPSGPYLHQQHCVGARCKGPLRLSAAAQACACPFGHAAPDLTGHSVPFCWPFCGDNHTCAGKRTTAVLSHGAAIASNHLLKSLCAGCIIFASDKLHPRGIFSGVKESCQDHF